MYQTVNSISIEVRKLILKTVYLSKITSCRLCLLLLLLLFFFFFFFFFLLLLLLLFARPPLLLCVYSAPYVFAGDRKRWNEGQESMVHTNTSKIITILIELITNVIRINKREKNYMFNTYEELNKLSKSE